MSGNIAQKIAEELKKQGCEIRILTYQYNKETYKINEDIEVEYVFNWSFYYELLLTKKIQKSPSKKNFFTYKTKKVISNILRNINSIGVNSSVVKKLQNKLELLYQEKPFDIVLSIAAPFEFQVANYFFSKSNKNVRSIIYQVDFWISLEDIGLPKIFRNSRRKNRKRLLDMMSLNSEIIMTPVVYEKESVANVKIAQLPLIKNNVSNRKKNKNQEIDIVYTGTLNRMERDPSWIIELIAGWNNSNIKLHFYHRGDCGSLIDNYEKKYKDLIINHGTVDGKIAREAVADANILLMIGTPNGDQVAGKTFDYVSTGKPIIYVSKAEKDLNVDFLIDYPLFFSVKENDKKSDILLDFIINNKDKTIPYEIVNNNYKDATPAVFCRNFVL